MTVLSNYEPDKVSVPAAPPMLDDVFAETVTDVQHYTDHLFRFRITRSPSFRFRSGEFVMIGLPSAEKPLYRAYSIASPSWDEEIEFFSIKMENGLFTNRLQKIKIGDVIFLRKKSTGTLVLDALVPGKRLYMMSTGTGVAPFASLIRDPETYEKFEEVILVQTCRNVADLEYITELVAKIKDNPLIGEFATSCLRVYMTTTREPSICMGRITDVVMNGKLFSDLDLPAISPKTDRGMICGSMHMVKDTKAVLEKFGLVEGSRNNPATYVVERAFVG